MRIKSFRASSYSEIEILSSAVLALVLSLFCAISAQAQAVDHDDRLDSGGYIFQLGLAKPSFTNLSYYEDIYQKPNIYPSLSVSYKLAHIPFASFGLGLKLSYYTTTGRPLLRSGDSYINDENSSITLKLIPYQLFAMIQVSPFRGRYVVFDGWVGYEELYYEEVRLLNTSDSTSTSTTSTTENSDSKNDVNSGWNKSLSFGFAINVLLNHFEEQSVRALESSTGLRFIYIGPFMEFSKALKGGNLFINQQKASVVDFSRTSYGLMFMFET